MGKPTWLHTPPSCQGLVRTCGMPCNKIFLWRHSTTSVLLAICGEVYIALATWRVAAQVQLSVPASSVIPAQRLFSDCPCFGVQRASLPNASNRSFEERAALLVTPPCHCADCAIFRCRPRWHMPFIHVNVASGSANIVLEHLIHVRHL